jgi:uncharacterized RDD family membrane protein YckC
MRNAFFIERLAAFITDVIIVTLVASIISMPFINTTNYKKLSDESNKITENYLNHKLSTSTYVNQTIDLNYEIYRETGVSNVLAIIIYALYFIVFQFYMGGQTIGKRLMKIKIVPNNGELTSNNYLIRGLLNNMILCNMSICVFALVNKNIYYYGMSIVTFMQFIYVIICIFMIGFRKDSRSLSDLISKTKVVKEKIK